MKKILMSTVTVALIALMIANVYAVSVPTPTFCEPYCSCGFTPGFWKHNISVRLELTNGKYSAFKGAPQDGVKLTDDIMDDLLEAINTKYGTSLEFEDLLANLKLKGWDPLRTNTANLFNEAAGYGPY